MRRLHSIPAGEVWERNPLGVSHRRTGRDTAGKCPHCPAALRREEDVLVRKD